MTPGKRHDSQTRRYSFPLAFIQTHVPTVLCPDGCTHDPCQPPVISFLFVDPRGPGAPSIPDDEARLIIADVIHVIQRRRGKLTQACVREQAGWPSSASKLSWWVHRRLNYQTWKACVDDLKLTDIP